MRKILIATLILISAAAFAQAVPDAPSATINNLYGAGVSYNPGASPAVAGTAFWAKPVSDGSKNFTIAVADFLPESVKPFKVNTSISAGVARDLFDFNEIHVYCSTSIGPSFGGTNVGWAFTGGCMAPVKVNKKKSYYLAPAVRFVKSSVSNGSDYQLSATVAFAFSN